MMVHRARDEQTVQRHARISDIAIRQNQDVAAIPHCRLCTGADRLKRLSQARLGGFIGSVDHRGTKAILIQRGNRLKLRLREHRRGQADASRMLGRFLKQISLRAEVDL